MSSDTQETTTTPQPPPSEGMRLDWMAVAPAIRSAVEDALGSPIVQTASQRNGFSPGVAARVQLADGRRVFIKAVNPAQNAETPLMHRREGQIVASLPDGLPVPRLLWSYDDPETGWVVLVFEDVEGRHPAQPWRLDELDRVMDALTTLSDALTPSPLSAAEVGTMSDQIRTRFRGWQQLIEQPHPLLDAWSLRHLEGLAALQSKAPDAVEGDTLLHFDIRGDNILLTDDQVWFVDWPLACVGAAWVDVVFFAPSVQMQGGPQPEYLMERHPACRNADPDAITAAVVAIAGFFTQRSLQPPPPGLPTLRPFQAAQGAVAREWVARRTGWR